jgi:hypothetical protein
MKNEYWIICKLRVTFTSNGSKITPLLFKSNLPTPAHWSEFVRIINTHICSGLRKSQYSILLCGKTIDKSWLDSQSDIYCGRDIAHMLIVPGEGGWGWTQSISWELIMVSSRTNRHDRLSFQDVCGLSFKFFNRCYLLICKNVSEIYYRKIFSFFLNRP